MLIYFLGLTVSSCCLNITNVVSDSCTCIISKYKLLQIGNVYTIPKAFKRHYYNEFYFYKAHNILRLINNNIWFWEPVTVNNAVL